KAGHAEAQSRRMRAGGGLTGCVHGFRTPFLRTACARAHAQRNSSLVTTGGKLGGVLWNCYDRPTVPPAPRRKVFRSGGTTASAGLRNRTAICPTAACP